MFRTRTTRWSLAALALSTAAALAVSQEDGDALQGALDERAEDAWSAVDDGVAALAVAVGGESVYESAAGERVTADTAIDAAPMAHAFLTALVMSAVQSERVALDDDLGRLLPDLVGEDSRVHVAHLLNHTSGFVDCHGRDPLAGKQGESIWGGLRDVVREPLETKPGECVAPTTTNTLLLAALVERLEERPAREVIEADLFGAFGMEDSSCDPPEGAVRPREAASGDEDDAPAGPAADFDPAWLRSSAADLLRYQRGLLDHELFGTELWREMTTPTRLRDGSRSAVGFGVRRISVGGEVGVRAGGASDDGAAWVAYFPEHDLTVAALGAGEVGDLEDLVDEAALVVMAPPAPPILDMPLSEDAQKPYVGTYQIGCNQLWVRGVGERLSLEDAERGEQVLLYQGEHRFVLRDEPGVRLEFRLDGDRADSFVLDDHGVEAVARRFE